MERASRSSVTEQEQQPEVEAPSPEVAASTSRRRDAGPIPAVEPEMQPQRQPTASERAFDLPDSSKAAAETQQVLAHIRSQAQVKAKQPMNIGKESMLYKRLSEHYLKEYLANPSPQTGAAAVEKVGAQLAPAKADPNDFWERSSTSWNSHPVPPAMKLLLPHAPTEMGAATATLSQDNRKHLPYIDAPQMNGSPNTQTGPDADVHGGGKNVSQLMHWATGVKFADQDPATMRDLFLAYEMYHLEGWDKFGEDSINDMISEDAGRIMGRQLQAGEISQDNLGTKLDDGFNESRAWVGSLIKVRQHELDAVITSPTVVESQMWWGVMPEQMRWWGNSTIYLDLLHGKSVAEVQEDPRTQHFIELYSMIYYADAWQTDHKKIQHSSFTTSMLQGKYNTAFAKSVKGEELTKREKVTAYLDAKAPLVADAVRPTVPNHEEQGRDDGKH